MVGSAHRNRKIRFVKERARTNSAAWELVAAGCRLSVFGFRLERERNLVRVH
jgi:hypothetical protein